MDIPELKQKLKKSGVNSSLYNLDATGRNDERLCLTQEDDKWVVFYAERNMRTTEKIFTTEDEACRYILNVFSERRKYVKTMD